MAESQVRIRVTTSGQEKLNRLNKSLNKTDRAANKLSGGLGKLSTAFAAVGAAAAAVGVAAIASKLTQVGKAAITAAGDVQKLQASFIGLTGSVETAEQLRNTLFQLSKTTPFKNEEILQSARRFLAVGVSVENLEGTLNRVGALAAQNGSELGRLGLIYSQVFAKGRLQGEELLQFLEAGVSITKELEQVTGLTGKALQDAISKGQISVENVNDAIKLATGEMTALDLAAKSVSVQFENVGDNVGEIGKAFSVSLAPAFASVFGVINEAFDRLFPSLESVQDRFDPLLEQAERFAQIVEDNPELVDAIASAFDSLLNFFLIPTVDAAEDLNDQLDQNPQGLIETIQNIELGIRRSFTAAAGLVKLLEAGRRLAAGGLVRGEAGNIGDLFQQGLADLQSLSSLKPFEIKTFTRPEVRGRAGDLDNGRGNPKGNGSGLTEKEVQRTRDLTAALADQNRVREEVLKLEKQILDANFAGNQILATQLRFQQEVIKIAGATAQKLKGVTDEQLRAQIVSEGDLKIAEAKAKSEDKLRTLRRDGATDAIRLENQLAEARQGALGSLEEENKLLQARLNGTEDVLKRELAIAKLVKAGTVKNKDGSTTQTVSREEAAAAVDLNTKLKEQLATADKLKGVYEQIGGVISNSIVTSIEQAIEGTADWNQILSDTLKQIGSLLIRAGVSSIGGPGGLGIPGFSSGGFVAPGQTALVGESGAELIRGGPAGTTVSPFADNNASLADARANAFAAGDSSDAFSEAAASLGSANATMASNAAQSEAAAYMSDTSDSRITVDYMQIGGLDVITKEQFAQGMAATEKAARARVFNDLKNKPAARGRIGI